MTESRIEPHKKAHFSLHISDRIVSSEDALGSYSSVKCMRASSVVSRFSSLIQILDNHKPAQTSDTRSTTLIPPSSTGLYNLRLEDSDDSRSDTDIFTFTGQQSQLKKSYVLVFDPSSQQATLEPLSSSYTFNLATRNGTDISSQHTKVHTKKSKDGFEGKDDEEHLFGEAAADDEMGEPDPDNPYDFRHFLSKEKEKRGDESDYHFASSPDYRTGTGSAVTTPQFGARGTAPTSARKAAAPVPKKRKTAATNPMVKPKKTQPTPAVRLQRTATADATPNSKSKAVAPYASKIKSSEVVHSSDESDGETAPLHEAHAQYHDSDEDAEGESDDGGGLEIQVPDARPPLRGKGALASLGLSQNIGGEYLGSPSNGPMSLASAANSDVEGSPNPHARNRNAQDEIDFGDLGGEDAEGEDDDDDYGHDGDVEHMDIGPPRQETQANERKSSVGGEAEDDEDDLEELMRRGLEGGDSSEESEEE
jgi:hypothetical protein